MQLPPLDLSTPKTAKSDSLRDVPAIAWLVMVTIAVTVIAAIALTMVHDAHTLGPNDASAEHAACLSDALDRSLVTGEPVGDQCDPVMPWYGAHPIWYALAIGGAVLVVGRLYLFMRRMEMTHGR